MSKKYRVLERAGARRFDTVSTVTNAHHALARVNRPDGLRDLILGVVPDQWRSGPVLGVAAYPDVLVAKAVTDGSALDLVLRPGAEPTRARLGLQRLVPGRAYRVSGGLDSGVVADERGEGIIEVDLGDRREVRVVPV